MQKFHIVCGKNDVLAKEFALSASKTNTHILTEYGDFCGLLSLQLFRKCKWMQKCVWMCCCWGLSQIVLFYGVLNQGRTDFKVFPAGFLSFQSSFCSHDWAGKIHGILDYGVPSIRQRRGEQKHPEQEGAEEADWDWVTQLPQSKHLQCFFYQCGALSAQWINDRTSPPALTLLPFCLLRLRARKAQTLWIGSSKIWTKTKTTSWTLKSSLPLLSASQSPVKSITRCFMKRLKSEALTIKWGMMTTSLRWRSSAEV